MLDGIRKICRAENRLAVWLACGMLLLFLVLVGIGITGSSLGWLKTYPGVSDILELKGERKLAGIYRGIRCDEFLNHGTPNALAQYHAHPHFPRYNRNLGMSARDFTVYHDTGIPVRHFVTWFRPAVWGFFFLDLRRALAWYWWFPVFAGFLGIWFLLNILFPEAQLRNFLLSFSLAASPLCAAWSFWQLGNLGGLCAAAGFFILLIRSGSAARCWILAAAMSWCGMVSVMTLYMPRIFPAMCLLALVTAAYLAENHLFAKLKKWTVLLPLLVSVIVCILLLLGWLHDASDAVRTLLETSYPGRRRLSGGTMGLWSVVQGWLAPLTIYKINFLNQCEMQGPLTLLFPLAAVWIIRFRQMKNDLMAWAVIIFAFWVYVYQLAGLPDWLAAATFWNRCNPPRCSASLALAQIIFLALLFSRIQEPFPEPGKFWNANRLTLISACCFLFLLCLPSARPMWNGLAEVYPGSLIVIAMPVIFTVFAVLSRLLLIRSRWFIPVFVLANLLPALCFNPVCVAPVKIVNHLESLVRRTPELKYGGCFLFLGEKNFPAVAAFAAGAKVLNGYFLYPDRKLHHLLFGNEPDPGKSFRLSNYDMVPVHDAANPFRIFDDGAEHIQIQLDAVKFDFASLPADFVGAPCAERSYLEKNPSLQLCRTGTELDIFRIVR